MNNTFFEMNSEFINLIYEESHSQIYSYIQKYLKNISNYSLKCYFLGANC